MIKISGSLTVACVLGLAAVAATPAVAFDEGRGSTLNTVLDMVGLAPPKEEDSIVYRERAPLVLPPKTELRQPRQPVSRTATNWPQDQEAVAARKRADQRRLPGERGADATQTFRPTALMPNPAGVAPRNNGPRECVMDQDRTNPNACDPGTFWKSLEVKKEEPLGLQAGVEPDRKYLTQPPKGYMKAKTTQKATFEDPKRIEEEHPTDFFRKKQTRE